MKHITTMHLENASAVTIGNFDGLHLGHRTLIQRTKQYAQQDHLLSVVFSFSPHPASVLAGKRIHTILSPEEKTQLLKEQGVDVYLEFPFDQLFSQMNPEEFIQMMIQQLNCRVIIVGEGYRFGRNRAGTADLIRNIAEKQNIHAEIVPHTMMQDESLKVPVKISSSRIRELILAGDMKKATALLGSPFFMTGTVASGKKLGRTLGFPTVNLIPSETKILPPNGVYITSVCYQDMVYGGVTNTGVRPTVDGASRTVETYIFDFHQDVYGQEMTIYFHEKIRDEIRFESVEALQTQIHKDAEAARTYLTDQETNVHKIEKV